MTKNSLKAHHQDSVIGQILDIVGQIKYHKESISPFYDQMEKWEIKEYSTVFQSNVVEVVKMREYLIENEAIFNNILNDYNLSVAVFINKYILN